MPTVKGKQEVDAFFDTLPAEIENRLLRGAAREGAGVVAAEAKERTWSEVIASAVRVKTRVAPDRITGVVTIVGQWPRSLATWAEHGTDPHVITTRKGSMVIDGKFVGKSIRHPGARQEPFLRPALDVKAGEARQRMQAYIDARITPGGIIGTDDIGDDE